MISCRDGRRSGCEGEEKRKKEDADECSDRDECIGMGDDDGSGSKCCDA